jgi:hypothetical protein
MNEDTKRRILETLQDEREARSKALASRGFTSEQAHAYIAGYTESVLNRIQELLSDSIL